MIMITLNLNYLNMTRSIHYIMITLNLNYLNMTRYIHSKEWDAKFLEALVSE